MKRTCLTLTLALLVSLLLAVSANAAEYGVIYTETDILQSEELTLLGEQELPRFTETYGIDLRVDVLTTIGDFPSVEEIAPVIYDSYEYGCGDGGHGVSLTLLVHEDGDGVALDEWYVYAGGDSWELTTNGPWNVFPYLNEIMTEENWAGDGEQDSRTLALAAAGMVEGLESFVLAGGVHSTIWSPVADGEPEENHIIMAPAEPDSFPAAGETIGYVTDTAGILTAEERQTLEEVAKEFSDRHGFGIYIITMDSFRDVTDSYDVFDGATTLYSKYKLGMGEDRKGILLLLSMNGRDFSLVTYSDYGNYVFDQETREGMTGYFLDDFAQDDWFAGFADYLSASDSILTDGPDKLQSEISGMVGTIFLFPLIVAAIVIFILGRKMKSVFRATEAEAYAGGGLELTRSYDQFTHATETRRKRKEDSDGGGGGGGRTHSRSSGGFGGTSGKF